MKNKNLLIDQCLLEILSSLFFVSIVFFRNNALFFERQRYPPMILNPSFCDQISIPPRLVFDTTTYSRAPIFFLVGERRILGSINDQILHRDTLMLGEFNRHKIEA